MNQDKLVEGPFGSNACYEQRFEQDGEEIRTWMCFGSGYSTSTKMDKDSDLVKNTLETSPELYKDLMHIDKNNRAWFPATITLPGKGMVFADGKSTKDWKGQTFKMDMANIAHFDSSRGFMDALEVIGFYDVD